MKISNVIENILSDKRVLDLISSFNNSDIYFASSTVGEIINYCIIHQTDKTIPVENVISYLKDLNNIKFQSRQIKDPASKEKYFQTERAKLIAATIAKSLQIDLKTAKDKQTEQIKQYFLKNYVENGYVFHSFPTARKNSVEQNGFTSIEKLWDNDAVKRVAKILEDHGAVTGLGGFSYYRPNGMYVEHNAELVLFHSLSAPEWFTFFTSAKHTQSSFNVADEPFYLKNYDACKQNVLNLMANLDLNEQEKKQVLDLFETTWQKLKLKSHTTALIKRKTINKTDVAPFENESMLDTITSALTDKDKQFAEHVGNVVNPETISASDVEILTIPPAEEFLKCEHFNTEKKEELFDPNNNFAIIGRGLLAGTLTISYKQFAACINAIRETFKDDANKKKELKDLSKKLVETIKQSPLSDEKKTEILEIFARYKNENNCKCNFDC